MKRKLIVGFLALCSITTVCPSVYASTEHYQTAALPVQIPDGLTGMQTGQIQPLILQKFPLPLVLMIHSLTSHGTAKKVTAMPLLLYILELIKITLKHLKVLPVM